MSDEERARNQKQLVALFVLASGGMLVLGGIVLLATGWQPLVGGVLLLAGVMDFGFGVFLRTR